MSLYILVLCVLFILYVYIGYPVVLWYLNRNKDGSYPDAAYNGDVSIVMVVCNEGESIRRKIDNLIALNHSGRKKIIIVDDYSTDNTCEIIESYTDSNIQIIKNSKRLGKASGLNRALEEVTTSLTLLVDCRQVLELDVIVNLSSWFEHSDEIGAVSGELIFRKEDGNDFSEGMDGYWKYEKFIRKNEALLSSVPGVTGAIYMLRTGLFEKIPEDTLLDDVYIPMVCAEKGYRVIYDDRAYAWDVPSHSVEKEKSRKIRTLSGNYQLLFRYPKWVLPGGHPIWWQFLSHKITRLAAPFVAIISILSAFSLYLSGNIFGLVYLVVSISVLMVAPVSIVFPAINKNRLLKLCSSFVVLNWFCVLAFFQYFFTNQSGSWKK